MTRYYWKIPAKIEKNLELEGFDPMADVVPSRSGIPVATGLSPEAWYEESSLFFDSTEARRAVPAVEPPEADRSKFSFER